ncbi:uncharacterized protein LOC108106327 [Drosophila eugracilis]|uniref:uncharacterized protein LOC108106327 n=1 Tax=Drosophila eugracilis TaxID=29029 RepID=UPI0007E7C22B|nr:uncharacterized protein LOC108106327 [Drosophila eugracilis]
MKFLSLLVTIFLILTLAAQLEARKRFYCLWSTKRTCSKSTPSCIRLQTSTTPTYSCKYYRSDCDYLLDSCKGATIYGQLGSPVSVLDNCVMNNIAIGSIGDCT